MCLDLLTVVVNGAQTELESSRCLNQAEIVRNV